MQLSVIIVNYNVRFFLEQCLHSVQHAMNGIAGEIWVVDNNSADGSLAYLQPLFPDVHFIANTENEGFAKANNKAIPFCTGEYILFLNPDTLVPEDVFHTTLAFLKAHPRTGALGVRMIDGKGRFLPESKRAFPSPAASFCKLTGLAALFPHSGFFNRYALGNLDEHATNTVDVLAGAFLMAPKALLQQLKGFDEDFFLYGEDIDLSYRIQKAGFENIYFAGTCIIHFKGESSAGTGMQRLHHFYNAMLVFVNKHTRPGSALAFAYFIRLAIALRGGVAAIYRLVKPVALPLIDMLLMLASLHLFRNIWINVMRQGKDFGVSFIPWEVTGFSLLFVLAAACTGLYDRKYKTSKALSSLAFSAILLLAVYSILPEQLRFSRGVVLWGALSGSGLILLLRQSLLLRSPRFFGQEKYSDGQTAVLCSETEYEAVLDLMKQSMSGKVFIQSDIGHISENDGELNKSLLPVEEIIFCAGDIEMKEIIAKMQNLSNAGLRFLFHYSGSNSMVGSAAEAVTPLFTYRIDEPYHIRMKRIVDLFMSLFFIISFPFHLLLRKKTDRLLKHAWQVLTGKKTWIGYAGNGKGLPAVKEAVISHSGQKTASDKDPAEITDAYYAKNYDWWQDLVNIIRYYHRL